MIQQITNSNKIKYKFLKEIVDKNFHGNKLNVFINLDSIFKSFYSPNMSSRIANSNNSEYFEISSEILNIAAHYRHFFFNYYKVQPTIYLYYSTCQPIYQKNIYDNYMMNNMELKHKDHNDYGVMNRIILNNIKLVNEMVKYVPQCYLLLNETSKDSKGKSLGIDPTAMINHIIKQTKNDNTMNLILTKDEMDFQLVNKNNLCIRLKHDESTLITKDNKYYYKFKNIKYRPDTYISHKLYSLVLALGGVKSRNIKGIKGYSFVKSMKKLEKCINNKLILNDYNGDVIDIVYAFKDMNIYEQLTNNFNCLDLKIMTDNITDSQKQKIQSRIRDKFDMATFFKLNEEYYYANPIKVFELFSGYSL